MRRLFAALGFVCAFGISTGVVAQTLPQIRPQDMATGPRAMAGADEAALWSAVGRLDTGESFCSATLITLELVLTAAHCLFHPSTDAPFSASDLTFLAGLRNGRAEAVRGVRQIFLPEDYTPVQGDGIEMIRRDLALLELTHPVSITSIRPIPVGQFGHPFHDLTVVSYGENREAFASIEEGCTVLSVNGPVRSLSCEVEPGSSGSPVLRRSQGMAEVVAVISAMGQTDAGEVSLAVTLDEELATLMERYVGASANIGLSTGGASFTSRRPNSNDRGSIGARFIRPERSSGP